MNFLCLIAVSMWLVVDINAANVKENVGRVPIYKVELATLHVSRSQRIFSLNLYKSLANRPSYHLAVSTLDAFIGLGKLYIGAKGETSKELNSALHLPTPTLTNSTPAFRNIVDKIRKIEHGDVRLANLFLYNAGLPMKSKFKRVMMQTFHSKKSDLVLNKSTGLKTIDGWYAEQADHMVGNKIIAVDAKLMPGRSITLTGTTYIKGSWAEKFDRCGSIVIDGDLTYGSWKAPYIQIVDEFIYGELESLKAKFVEIPLSERSDVSMFIIRPNKNDGLRQLEIDINERIVCEELFNGQKQTVQVMLPEFLIEYKVDLVEPLHNMGVKKMFGNGRNFDGIVYKSFAKVNEIRHKVVIDGRGSGARKVCAAEVPVRGDDIDPIKFTANHPFMILIATKDENPVIVSIARYTTDSSSVLDFS